MTDNLLIRMYVNKIETGITFKIKTRYYLKLLIAEMIKLLESTKDKISKEKNSENLPHLEINEVVIARRNNISNDYQHDSRVFYTFVSNKSFGVTCN